MALYDARGYSISCLSVICFSECTIANCNVYATSSTCSECATGYDGDECLDCANGYFDSDAANTTATCEGKNL